MKLIGTRGLSVAGVIGGASGTCTRLLVGRAEDLGRARGLDVVVVTNYQRWTLFADRDRDGS